MIFWLAFMLWSFDFELWSFIALVCFALLSCSLSLLITLFSALFGVLPPLFRCFIHLCLLCFITFTLLLLTCLFSYARYSEEAFMLWLLLVPLYLWDTNSILVRLIWSHHYEFHLHFCMLCLSCIVLQALYVVVFATHHLWFIFTLELSCLCRTLWFLTCFLWLVLAAWIWVSCSCYLLLIRIFIRFVPFLILFTSFCILLLT